MIQIFEICNKVLRSTTMNTVRTFNNSPITIRGSEDNILFKAIDIGTALCINDITATVRNFGFDDMEQITMSSELFLTVIGVSNIMVIYKRRALTKVFTKWIWNVIRDIRHNDTRFLELN